MLSPSPDSSHSFSYVDSDVPAGMTLSAWRGKRVRAAGPRRRSLSLRRRARAAGER